MTTFQLTKELLKTTGYLLLILLALAIALGVEAYDAGMAFRGWCDRLVEDSQYVAIAGYLSSADDTDDFDDTVSSDEILAEWRDRFAHMQTCVRACDREDVPDWYKEAVAQAADRLLQVA